MSASAILEALACGRHGCRCAASVQRGKGETHCPAHDDSGPSLAITERGGKVLVHCHGGCSSDRLIDQLRILGLWQAARLTIAELAEAKLLSEDFLTGLGVRDSRWPNAKGKPAVEIPYHDASGKAVGTRYRLSLDGGDRFRWAKGAKTLPYGLPKVEAARQAGQILIVEGESDCWTLWAAGIATLGVPGVSTWQPEWAKHLEGIARVLVWREPDQGGDSLVSKVGASRPDALIINPPEGIKDPSALWLSLNGDVSTFQTHMRKLAKTARPFAELRREAQTAEAQALLETSGGVLDNPVFLRRLVDASQGLGHVANRRNQAALHLALATVKQPRLAAVVVKGQSSAGKNDLVQSVIRVWPTQVFVTGLSSLSEKFLAYDSEDYRHKFLVLAEASAVVDGQGAYLLRTLISEGRIDHGTVDDVGHGHEGRRVVKEGPVGVIFTTTHSEVDAELETRCWTLEVPDDAGYIRQALVAVADRRNRELPLVEVLPQLQAGLGWLLIAGNAEVDIQFGRWLADRVPAKEPRMLRLFDRLLGAIQASAWLHQRQRTQDGRGRIVASVGDYAVARSVMGAAFDIGVTGMTEKQGQALQAMVALCAPTDGQVDQGTTIRAIAKRLGQAPGTAAGHVHALVRKGLVRALGDRGPYRPDAPAEAAVGLPTPEELVGAFPELATEWVDPVATEAVSVSPRNRPDIPISNPASASPWASEGVGMGLGTCDTPAAPYQHPTPIPTPLAPHDDALSGQAVGVSVSGPQRGTAPKDVGATPSRSGASAPADGPSPSPSEAPWEIEL